MASRVVSAFTFGFPSRSPPIQVPQRSAGSGSGARRPDGAVAFSRPAAAERESEGRDEDDAASDDDDRDDEIGEILFHVNAFFLRRG
jgi:hypothetical protein